MDPIVISFVETTASHPTSPVLAPHLTLLSGCTLMDMDPLELGSELCGHQEQIAVWVEQSCPGIILRIMTETMMKNGYWNLQKVTSFS